MAVVFQSTGRVNVLNKMEAPGKPRLLLLTMVALTGAAGFLTSTILLRLRVHAMAWRYSISAVAAYGVFVGLIRLWMLAQRTRIAKAEVPPVSGPDGPAEPPKKSLHDWLEWLDFFEPESLAILLVVAAVTSIVFVVWYLVSTIALAPEFLAELLLDGVFSAALYRALNRTERRHWLKTVFARTRAPFLWTLSFFVFLGAISQRRAGSDLHRRSYPAYRQTLRDSIPLHIVSTTRNFASPLIMRA